MDTACIKMDRLYGDLAYLWPLVSPPEDYAAEARCWRDVLRRKLGPGRHSILELGVGGGHNLSHLTADFEATAVDLSPDMLGLSKRLNPGVEHLVGDMRTVRLGRKFKAVFIHDAISYMRTEADLRATFDTAAVHLEAGGVFITSPDRFRESFHDPCVDSSTRSDGRTELTFIEYTHDPDPADTTVETIMFYLIRTDGRLQIELDRHITGLFSRRRWLDLMEQAGFQVEQCPCGPEDSPQSSVLLVGTLSPSAEPV
jgi:SAM-dependent methyltransferase